MKRVHITLLIDVSGSMKADATRRMFNELVESVRAFNATPLISLCFFDGYANWKHKLVPADKVPPLETLHTGGGTDLYGALEEVVTECNRSAASDHNLIVVVSDFETNMYCAWSPGQPAGHTPAGQRLESWAKSGPYANFTFAAVIPTDAKHYLRDACYTPLPNLGARFDPTNTLFYPYSERGIKGMTAILAERMENYVRTAMSGKSVQYGFFRKRGFEAMDDRGWLSPSTV